MIIGYARVSTSEQNIEAQTNLLKHEGCEKLYTDIDSGTKENRVGLTDMISHLRQGDLVITYKSDRIFRSLKNMVNLIDRFNHLGVHFKSLSEPQFDTTTANGKLILHIFSAIAEFERNLISERTKIGLQNARSKNKILGRPQGSKKNTLDKYDFAHHLHKTKNLSITQACKKAQIGKTTFFKIRKEVMS